MQNKLEDKIKVDTALEFYKEKIPSFQLELAKKYYTVDEENKVIELSINVEKITDILDFSIGNRPTLNIDYYEKIISAIECFPKKYKAIIVIRCKDFENYSEDELKELLVDNIKIRFVQSNLSYKRKNVISLVFLLIGIIFMLLNIILLKGTIIEIKDSNQLWVNILSEILDISSWVFVWEAVTIYFLERIENRSKRLMLKDKLLDIKFSQSKKED